MEWVAAAVAIAPTWLHVVAAMTWIGGMMFLTLAVVPSLRRAGFTGERRELFRAIARRFRIVVWTSIVILLSTGPLVAVLRFASLDPAGWPTVLKVKVMLVVILVAMTAAHDLWLGPASAASDGQGSVTRHISPWMARASLLLALAIVACAVVLARS